MFLLLLPVAGLMVQPQAPSSNLDAWFLKDKSQQSCASCHSPDGIELRSFASADILRRAARHHSEDIAAKIRVQIEGLPKLTEESGTELRPMQSGGKALPGLGAAERDNAFIANLNSRYPKLFSPIQNEADALAFQTVILSIDLANLPIGIEMNRLSEDGAHGDEHKSIANWFPDMPVFDSSELRPELDAYRANPTEQALDLIDQKVQRIAKVNTAFAGLSLAKYRSMMVYQHELRTKSNTPYLPKGNPFWQVAEFARVYAEANASAVNVPADIVEAKDLNRTYPSQLKQIRVPWFWLGWTRDPSLTKSGSSRETIRGDYFCKYLEEDGPYMSHESFMLARKLAEHSRNPLFAGYPFEIQYSFFLTNTPLVDREPKEKKTQQLFRQFTANSFKMSLFLLQRDLIKTGKTIRPFPQSNQISYISKYMDAIQVPSKDLTSQVLKRLASAKRVN